jgi:hypothetical protein
MENWAATLTVRTWPIPAFNGTSATSFEPVP